MKPFTYKRSLKVIVWGATFDSVLELKYALAIRDEYEFLRAHIPIYYDPRTNLPTNYIRENIRRYTPDFLIRHKITREAFLIELKPRAFEENEQLVLRKKIAENYIRWKSYDWSYKVVYDDEITLKPEQRLQLETFRLQFGVSYAKLKFKEMNDRFDHSQRALITKPPSNTDTCGCWMRSNSKNRRPAFKPPMSS